MGGISTLSNLRVIAFILSFIALFHGNLMFGET